MTILEDGLNILGRIGNNAQNLRLLLDCLDSLVPFVGAGLSYEFGYPSWSKLLEDLADQAGLRSQVDGFLASYQFEEAAEALATALPNIFDDTLRLAFDQDKLPRPLGKGAVRHVAGIARGGPSSPPTLTVCSKLPSKRQTVPSGKFSPGPASARRPAPSSWASLSC